MARTALLSRAALAALLPLLTGCPTADRLGSGGPPSTGGVTAWVVSGDDLLDANSVPQAENTVFSAGASHITLRSTANDVVAFQVGLRGNGSVDVRVSDLAESSGATLTAAENISRFHVLTTRVDQFESWYPWHTGRSALPIDVPDVLVPWDAPRGGGAARLESGSNRIVWVDVRVPAGTSAGEYQGKIDIARPGGALIRSFDLTLNVADVELPERRTLPFVARVDPRDLLASHLAWPRSPAEETRLLPDTATHAQAVALVRATMELLHEHRLTPVLWASFPKYRPSGPTAVDIDWEPYDALVGPWLDGSGFADQTGLAAWPLPVSLDYPSATLNGGVGSPQYERLLRAYLTACEQHFAEKKWIGRAFVRLIPPGPLTADSLERAGQALGVVRAVGPAPLIAHLPMRSLRALGWVGAPALDAPPADILAPPAMWFEPSALSGRAGGRGAWFMPDEPPYSPSLRPEGLPGDAGLLPWIAYRYRAGGIWIEHAADDADSVTARGRRSASAALLRSGAEFGLDKPVATVRLKRLRRGLLDYELLRLVENRSQPLLARRTIEQLVRWAFTDAAAEALVAPRASGWPRDPSASGLARNLLLDELSGASGMTAGDWGRLMSRSNRLVAQVRGVRLHTTESETIADVSLALSNATELPVMGAWTLGNASGPLRLRQPMEMTAAPGARAVGTLTLSAGGVAYSADGFVPLALQFDAGDSGAIDVPARLAVTSCVPSVAHTSVDGSDDDWLVAPNNTAGDFRLVRGDGQPGAGGSGGAGVPATRTRANFWHDDQFLYVAITAGLAPGDRLHFRADNTIPIDGAIPWGQDLIEIILDPATPPAASPSELYVLQIKPNGLVVGRKGALTDPPMADSTHWESGARVAVSTRSDAWLVEAAIPLANLGAAAARAAIWGVNVTRLDSSRGEYSSWSGARGHAYAPDTLGNLIFVRPAPQ